MVAMTTQLQSLAKRIPKSYIKQKPGGFAADYCSHADVQQMLIAKLGVPPSQEVTQIIRPMSLIRYLLERAYVTRKWFARSCLKPPTEYPIWYLLAWDSIVGLTVITKQEKAATPRLEFCIPRIERVPKLRVR